MSKNCNDCVYSEVLHYEVPCANCHGTVERPNFKPREELKETAPIDQAKERLFKSLDDIQKIIDDAMEKGDRSVHISVVGDGVDISVQPYKEEDEWGIWKREIVDPDKLYIHREYRCSVCNASSPYMHPHCPICGTKMKLPEPEGEKDA